MIPFLTGDLIPKLLTTMKGAVSLRATTAFWTISHDYLDNKLAKNDFLRLMRNNDSFFISDISTPTIIRNIVEFKKSGANMWFYLKRAKDNLLKYDHLLHSKIFLFENKMGDYTLVIGSQNMTGRALNGINKEAGVLINLNKGDLLLAETIDYLNSIKRDSIQVDPSKTELYEFIQDQSNLESIFTNTPLLYAIADDKEYNDCIKDEIIQLLGMNDKKHKFFDKIQSLTGKVAILIENSTTSESKVCLCNISSIGEIKPTDNKTFEKKHEKRMYFYIGLSEHTGASTPSCIFKEKIITPNMFYMADFHAELKIASITPFVYEKSEVLREKLNPWNCIEEIEDNSTILIDRSKIKIGEGEEMRSERYRPNKIRIEEIDKNYLKGDFKEHIQKHIAEINAYLDKVDPVRFNQTYLEIMIKIDSELENSPISETNKKQQLEAINRMLMKNYEERKKNDSAARRNIRLLEPHLVVSSNDKG